MKLEPKKPETLIDKALDDTYPASDPPAISGLRTRLEREQRDIDALKDERAKADKKNKSDNAPAH